MQYLHSRGKSKVTKATAICLLHSDSVLGRRINCMERIIKKEDIDGEWI